MTPMPLKLSYYKAYLGTSEDDATEHIVRITQAHRLQAERRARVDGLTSEVKAHTQNSVAHWIWIALRDDHGYDKTFAQFCAALLDMEGVDRDGNPLAKGEEAADVPPTQPVPPCGSPCCSPATTATATSSGQPPTTT